MTVVSEYPEIDPSHSRTSDYFSLKPIKDEGMRYVLVYCPDDCVLSMRKLKFSV